MLKPRNRRRGVLWIKDGPITFLGGGWVLLFGEELEYWPRGMWVRRLR